MKKIKLSGALVPFMLLGSPVFASASSARVRSKNVAVQHFTDTKKENIKQSVQNPFALFGKATVKTKIEKKPDDVLAFLQENGLLDSQADKASVLSGDIRKEFAATCRNINPQSGLGNQKEIFIPKIIYNNTQ